MTEENKIEKESLQKVSATNSIKKRKSTFKRNSFKLNEKKK